jgi:uncharacterized protein (TIGR02271 family)
MASRPVGEERRDREDAGDPLVRHEEELRVDVAPREAGSVRAATSVESVRVRESFPRQIERVEAVDRLPAEAGDSGQIETLADGSVSIPVFEEELVITKRLVVRERVIVRKATVTEHQAVEADLRRERIEVEVDERPPSEGPPSEGPPA